MDKVSAFLKCVLGPRLIRIYATPQKSAFNYLPSNAENLGEGFLKLMRFSQQLGIYTSPLVVWVLYKKNYFCYDGFHSLVRFSAICAVLCIISLAARGIGRLQNSDYVKFVETLEILRRNCVPNSKKLLLQYDFDFSAWPVEFDYTTADKDSKKPRHFLDHLNHNRTIIELIQVLPCKIIGYLVAHSIGIRLLYPGTIIQHFIESHLVDGRARLLEEYRGERVKLVTQDRNAIDVVVIDRRGKPEHPNGDFLVICCEGNAGFYEVGMIGTPIEAGYSVMGWNHPGFGGSTGAPFPRQEQYAVDIVMQYAVDKLQFPMERIILYGWSIGGFTASWAAMNYPNVRAVVLDATFDHLLPLAANVMPAPLKSIVSFTVKHFLNLNVADQLVRYPGPVLLYRRTRDEVIALEPGSLSSNRGNDLLIQLLQFRFPHIVTSATTPLLLEWLSLDSTKRDRLVRELEVDNGTCTKKMQKYIEEHSNSFPMLIGQNWNKKMTSQMAIFLASRHLMDFDSTHCTPLPPGVFRSFQEIGLEADFVEISDFVEIARTDL